VDDLTPSQLHKEKAILLGGNARNLNIRAYILGLLKQTNIHLSFDLFERDYIHQDKKSIPCLPTTQGMFVTAQEIPEG